NWLLLYRVTKDRQRETSSIISYSLPSEELDVAARSAATSSWFLMSNFIAGKEYGAILFLETLMLGLTLYKL
ncbi:hypothetical protein, partial [Pseudanabaena sp. 'Roaring Creek']|uniref:hypothetical protein n=1 Tax=Pseudanabaena sp. 'Roaring Creek' TaxID=1681830 RepID=UPI000AC2BC4C